MNSSRFNQYQSPQKGGIQVVNSNASLNLQQIGCDQQFTKNNDNLQNETQEFDNIQKHQQNNQTLNEINMNNFSHSMNRNNQSTNTFYVQTDQKDNFNQQNNTLFLNSNKQLSSIPKKPRILSSSKFSFNNIISRSVSPNQLKKLQLQFSPSPRKNQKDQQQNLNYKQLQNNNNTNVNDLQQQYIIQNNMKNYQQNQDSLYPQNNDNLYQTNKIQQISNYNTNYSSASPPQIKYLQNQNIHPDYQFIFKKIKPQQQEQQQAIMQQPQQQNVNVNENNKGQVQHIQTQQNQQNNLNNINQNLQNKQSNYNSNQSIIQLNNTQSYQKPLVFMQPQMPLQNQSPGIHKKSNSISSFSYSYYDENSIMQQNSIYNSPHRYKTPTKFVNKVYISPRKTIINPSHVQNNHQHFNSKQEYQQELEKLQQQDQFQIIKQKNQEQILQINSIETQQTINNQKNQFARQNLHKQELNQNQQILIIPQNSVQMQQIQQYPNQNQQQVYQQQPLLQLQKVQFSSQKNLPENQIGQQQFHKNQDKIIQNYNNITNNTNNSSIEKIQQTPSPQAQDQLQQNILIQDQIKQDYNINNNEQFKQNQQQKQQQINTNNQQIQNNLKNNHNSTITNRESVLSNLTNQESNQFQSFQQKNLQNSSHIYNQSYNSIDIQNKIVNRLQAMNIIETQKIYKSKSKSNSPDLRNQQHQYLYGQTQNTNNLASILATQASYEPQTIYSLEYFKKKKQQQSKQQQQLQEQQQQQSNQSSAKKKSTYANSRQYIASNLSALNNNDDSFNYTSSYSVTKKQLSPYKIRHTSLQTQQPQVISIQGLEQQQKQQKELLQLVFDNPDFKIDKVNRDNQHIIQDFGKLFQKFESYENTIKQLQLNRTKLQTQIGISQSSQNLYTSSKKQNTELYQETLNDEDITGLIDFKIDIDQVKNESEEHEKSLIQQKIEYDINGNPINQKFKTQNLLSSTKIKEEKPLFSHKYQHSTDKGYQVSSNLLSSPQKYRLRYEENLVKSPEQQEIQSKDRNQFLENSYQQLHFDKYQTSYKKKYTQRNLEDKNQNQNTQTEIKLNKPIVQNKESIDDLFQQAKMRSKMLIQQYETKKQQKLQNSERNIQQQPQQIQTDRVTFRNVENLNKNAPLQNQQYFQLKNNNSHNNSTQIVELETGQVLNISQNYHLDSQRSQNDMIKTSNLIQFQVSQMGHTCKKLKGTKFFKQIIRTIPQLQEKTSSKIKS
ncbi:hypothetical protein PPERSA_02373 [Pseudocohnilembus persalinus]|uniref:Uncharacterized protein n=1 Tax=Pseudocohnilembus persalinus TaxID=266149 RepID=A0A0V0QUD0_PSEPJ|nr:hypothetical protein PPERSA_02373 [Pseudocohnilembus persalinus]|eukprot:KRX05841.1 hypothetical protein PPERSA_02373 [Pseudocohnilembus persalinus]